MLNWLKSSVSCPESNKTVELETVRLTYVRWLSRHDKFASGTRECVEAFPDPEDAKKFAESLKAAFELVRNTCDNTVTITSK